MLEFGHNGAFKIFLRVIIVQAEEIKDIGVLKNKICRHLSFISKLVQIAPYHFFGLLGNGCTLIKHAVDFGFQSAG